VYSAYGMYGAGGICSVFVERDLICLPSWFGHTFWLGIIWIFLTNLGQMLPVAVGV